jgi:hypothetical protein
VIVILRIPEFRTGRIVDAGCRMLHGVGWYSLRGVVRFVLTATALLGYATAVGVDHAPASKVTVQPRLVRSQLDVRVSRLGAFFEAHHCPEPQYVDAYIRAADRYGLDYRLLPAISVRETSCGWTEKNNNRWGFHPKTQTFVSVESGIEFLSRHLAEQRPYAGKSLNEKLFTYNPRVAYPAEVEHIMKQIE